MSIPSIRYEDAINRIDWQTAMKSLRLGHSLPRAEIADSFLGPGDATLLNRSAFIRGFGYAVKAVTVVRGNTDRALPTTQGIVSLFAPDTGELVALIDSRLVTEVKTVSDSLLGASLLARPDSRKLLIAGGGAIAQSLLGAYPKVFPQLEQIAIWTRRPEQAQALAAQNTNSSVEVVAADSLASYARNADIISTATMTHEPILKGRWISPGTHVDLIGAFKKDMREADDALLQKASIYVDSRETTLAHIGEVATPLASGAITLKDIKGDLYDLVASPGTGRTNHGEITVFKNGGGAHLDLMIGHYIANTVANIVT